MVKYCIPLPYFPFSRPQAQEAATAHQHPLSPAPLWGHHHGYQTPQASWTSLLSCSTELPTQKHRGSCVCSPYIGRPCSTPGFNNHTSGKRWTFRPLCFVCILKKRLNFKQLLYSDYFKYLTNMKEEYWKNMIVYLRGWRVLYSPEFYIFQIHMSSNNRKHMASFSFSASKTEILWVNAYKWTCSLFSMKMWNIWSASEFL